MLRSSPAYATVREPSISEFPFGAVVFAALVSAGLSCVLAFAWRVRVRAEINRLERMLEAAEQDALAARIELAERRAHFDKIECIAGMGSWSCDLRTGKLVASDAYLGIFGVTLDNMPATPRAFAERFIDDDEQLAEIQANATKLDQGRPVHGIRRLRLDNGERKWVRFRSEPYFDDNGVVEGFRGFVRDVTNEREKEIALVETTALLSEVHRIARICHFVWDLKTDALEVSDDYFETFGIAPEHRYTHMHHWVERHCHPDDRPQVHTSSSHTIAAGKPYAVVRRSRGSDGIYRYYEIHGEPVRNAAGEVVAYRGTARDVSEHQNNLIRIAQSEERFRRLTELSSDWYWEQDTEHRFTFISRATTVVSGKPRSEVLGKTRWELFPTALTEDEWNQHKAMLAARQPYYELVTRVTRPHAAEVVGYFSISGEPVFDHKNRFLGYRGIGKDITQRKMAERALSAKTAELSRANDLLREEAARRQQLERSMLMVVEAAMMRVGSELHDELGQDLTGIALLSKALERKLAVNASPGASEAARISDLANQTIRHARMISHGLSPHIMGDGGLVSALAQLGADISALNTVACETLLSHDAQVEDEVASRTLYRIAQESTTHALRHTNASRLRVSLKPVSAGVQIVIANDGASTRDVDSLETQKCIESVRHRARTIGARVDVKARRHLGTVIRVVLPVAASPQTLDAQEGSVLPLRKPDADMINPKRKLSGQAGD
jgi:PAS domain S-box-containing protein